MVQRLLRYFDFPRVLSSAQAAKPPGQALGRKSHTLGATDEFGYEAVEKPVHIHDGHATVLHRLGLDHERLTFNYGGRDFRLTDVYANVVAEMLNPS